MKAKKKDLCKLGKSLLDIPHLDPMEPSADAERKRGRKTAQLLINTCDDYDHLRAVFVHLGDIREALFTHFEVKL